jgi:uncharacterized phage-associated protein
VNTIINIDDVCEWFLQKHPVSNKKLQKLCYYAQAWSYALKEEPLIVDSNNDAIVFEAWIHGPVYPNLYRKYADKGWKNILPENRHVYINSDDLELLDSVLFTYGDSTGNSLEALSHTELPWIIARAGLKADEGSSNPIGIEDMKKYYRSIYLDN